MENMREFREKQSEEFNEFVKGNIFYLFGTEEEAIETLAKEGLSVEDVVDIGLGGYLRKTKIDEYEALVMKLKEERHEFILNNLYDSLIYYLWDYEIEISLSYTYEDVPKVLLDLSDEEIKANQEVINKAFRDYREEFYKLN